MSRNATNASNSTSGDASNSDEALTVNLIRSNSPMKNPKPTRATISTPNYSWAGKSIAAGSTSAQSTSTRRKKSPGYNPIHPTINYKIAGIGRAQDPSRIYNWNWATDFGGTVDVVTISF